MKFGVGLPVLETSPSGLPGDDFAEMVRYAEEAGFYATFLTDHPAPSRRWYESGAELSFDPFVGLSFVAGVTKKIKLLTALAVLGYRNPYLVAKSIATVDRLSNGRFVFGVGTGYLEPEFKALDADFENRNATFDDTLATLISIWREPRAATDPITLPIPVQPAGPPIWIGGNSRKARQRAALFGDAWLPVFTRTRDDGKTGFRSPGLREVATLKTQIDELVAIADEHGRGRQIGVNPLIWDIDGLPSHKKLVEQLRDIGVHNVTVRCDAATVADACRFIDAYANDIIGNFDVSE